jgi:signal transduction histidine kinase
MSASLFSLFHSDAVVLDIDPQPIPRGELLKMLIESAADTEALLDPSRGVVFRVDRQSLDVGQLFADPRLLNQAVLNLLDNASKYSFSNTVVNLRVKATRRSIGIEVSNVGMPISPSETNSCFERGWRGERAREVTAEGSGIGLWVANHIMLAHGGRVEITPTNADGLTRIALLLPHDDGET